MSSDLDKSQISSEIIEKEVATSETFDSTDSCVSSSEIEEDVSSENCSEADSSISCEDNKPVEENKDDADESSSSCKRNKVEEDTNPTSLSTPFGTKSIFGSAAKTIVSFNSISANTSLPSKSLFAEEINETPLASTKNETEPSEYEVITGEEDECTITSMKGKLFEFSPETKDWHERGIGMFKLNKSKKTGKYRIIMRTEGVQKLILNSNLFPKMTCEVVQEKNIRFSANNFESKIQAFILRMKNFDDASTLENSLKDAIDSLSTEEGC